MEDQVGVRLKQTPESSDAKRLRMKMRLEILRRL
jgi:hypothetical protein